MRILAVTPYYEPEGGGLERYAHAILHRIAARQHEVEAISFTRGGLPSGPLSGVAVQRLAARFRLGNAPIDFGFQDRVRQAMHDFDPDVVVAHTPVPFAAEAAFGAVRRTRVPFVVTYHAGLLSGSSHLLGFMASVHRATFERRMLAGASALIAVSPFVRDHALRRHRHRVALVPPGVDMKRFHTDGPAPGRGILFVGPLSSNYGWKGVDVLVRAFGLVRRLVPDATLTLVGDGDRRSEFQGLARSMDGALRIPGRLGDDALVAAYHEAAVVVLPSTSQAEAFGMVLAEANSCSRPVVASRVGGIPDFVRDGENGLLARPGDVCDLVQKVGSLLLDPGLARKLGEAGHDLVRREHDWDTLAARTQDVLEGAVEGARGRTSRA